jgi:hypothetical protein
VITSRTLKRTGKKVYDVRLRTPDGRVYNRTFATKKAAEAFEDSEKTDRRRGGWVDPRYANMTVKELAARWLASNPAKRSKTRTRDESSSGSISCPAVIHPDHGSATFRLVR